MARLLKEFKFELVPGQTAAIEERLTFAATGWSCVCSHSKRTLESSACTLVDLNLKILAGLQFVDKTPSGYTLFVYTYFKKG